MKNILRNNRLMLLIIPFAIIFVGNVFSMRMTPQEMERAKIATRKMMKEIQEQQQPQLQQEREKQYQSGKYFVYEKGTSKGILVDQAWLEKNSEMVKGLVESSGSRPQEIDLPFPIDDIKLVFLVMSKKVNLEKLSVEQLNNVIKIEKYLLAPQDVISKAVAYQYDKISQDASLEELVEDFNRMPDLHEKIFMRIVDIANQIVRQFSAQYDKMSRGKYTDYFKDCKGKMISIIPESNSLLIPDYTVLNNIKVEDENALQQDKKLEAFIYIGVEHIPWVNYGMRSKERERSEE